MKIEIKNFKLKLHQDCIGTFDTTIYLEECSLLINNISLYQWKNGSKELYFPSTFKKEPLVESEDLKKFILEELYGNFLKTYMFFRNSIFKEQTFFTIEINLKHMLQGISIDLYDYESDINEELKKFKAECSIVNEEIRITYNKNEKDEDHKFEILNTIFKFIEDKNPTLREDIKTITTSLNQQKKKIEQDDCKFKDSEGLWRDKETHELIYELLPERIKKSMEEMELKHQLREQRRF